MLKRFTFGLAVGYVLGARAGEERYEQIKGLFDRALDQPAVARVVESGRELADERGRGLVEGLKDRASSMLDRARPDRNVSDSEQPGATDAEAYDADDDAYEDTGDQAYEDSGDEA